jgi:hypothetical protein
MGGVEKKKKNKTWMRQIFFGRVTILNTARDALSQQATQEEGWTTDWISSSQKPPAMDVKMENLDHSAGASHACYGYDTYSSSASPFYNVVTMKWIFDYSRQYIWCRCTSLFWNVEGSSLTWRHPERISNFI